MLSCKICDEDGLRPAFFIKHMHDKHLKKCSVILRRIDCKVEEALKGPNTYDPGRKNKTIV